MQKKLKKANYRDRLLNNKTNLKLRNIVNDLYHQEGSVGTGSTADALRYEFRTGNLVKGRSHMQKAINGN